VTNNLQPVAVTQKGRPVANHQHSNVIANSFTFLKV